ncbi:hypothetical protein B0H14DRAFT_2584485 [Mycena olivaceomarginata]|nr:hypothetical protein B0H14DRAFT_2584485 [Mycena olivaceomarginata]
MPTPSHSSRMSHNSSPYAPHSVRLYNPTLRAFPESLPPRLIHLSAAFSEKNFMDGLHSGINETTYVTWMTNRWLLINLDLLALFASTFLHGDAGLAGLAITTALTFSKRRLVELKAGQESV